MLIFLVAFGTGLYLHLGFQLGDIGWNAWQARRRTLAAFFAFPVSWYRDTVGVTESVPMLEGINPPQGAYRAVVLVFWPLLAVWSCAIIAAFLAPDLLLKRLFSKPNIPADENEEMEQRSRLLEEKSRELDQVIWELESESAPVEEPTKRRA